MLSDEREPAAHPSPRAVAHWRYVDGATVLVLSILAMLGLSLWRDELGGAFSFVMAAMGGTAMLMLAWFAGVLPMLAVRLYRYELTDDAVYTQRGLLTRRRVVVPYARVQSVKTTSGPLERRMGLTTLVLLTAADAHRIAMLDDEVADELRERIGRLAREAHDDL